MNRDLKTRLRSQTLELIWKCPAASILVMLSCLAVPVQAQDDMRDLVPPELPRISASSGSAKSEAQSAAQSAAAAKKIQEALQGKPTAETGDGMLNDVLGVIQQRGSVLDGWAMDPDDANQSYLPLQVKPSMNGTTPSPVTKPNQDIRAAEQLLATARKLQASFPAEAARLGDANQSDRLPVSVLVLQLRLRAVDLLKRGLAADQREATPVVDVDSLIH